VSDFCFFDQHISLSEFQSSFCSKRVRGGGGGSGNHNAQEFMEEVQQQFRNKQQRSKTTTPTRWKRPIDQVEHIARERQQRDNMTSRFSTLETLLPPGPKVTTTMMSLLNVFAQFCCGSRLETVAIVALDYDPPPTNSFCHSKRNSKQQYDRELSDIISSQPFVFAIF